MTIYNSRGNQIDIAQIAVYNNNVFYKSNQIKCWFLVRGENQSTQGKASRSRINKLNPHWWKARALTIVPTLLPVRESNPGHIGGRQVLSPLCQPCHLDLVGCSQGWFTIRKMPNTRGKTFTGHAWEPCLLANEKEGKNTLNNT